MNKIQDESMPGAGQSSSSPTKAAEASATGNPPGGKRSGRRGTVVVNATVHTSLVAKADNLFAKLPLIGTFFKMLRPKACRHVGEEKFVTLKTGMFSWQIIYELFSLKFMQYKTLFGEENDDLRENFINQQTSVGLVAALLFTVFVSFIQNEAGDNFDRSSVLQTFEIGCWSMAAVGSLASTCLSVLLIIAVCETNDASDSNHFLRLLSEFTFGLGPISPVFFLLLSVVFAVVAFIPYLLISFGITCTILVMIIAVVLVGLFGLFVVQTVATLKVAKETDALIQASYRVADLNLAHVRIAFKRFVELETKAPYVDGESLAQLPLDCGEDSFVEFVQTNTQAGLLGHHHDGGVDNDNKSNVPSLIKLSLVSERRCRAFFQAYLEANLFDSVSVDTFTPPAGK